MKIEKRKYRTSTFECNEVLTLFRTYEIIDLFIGHHPRDFGYTWLLRHRYDGSFHIISEDRNGTKWLRKQCITRWGMPPKSRTCHVSGKYLTLIKGMFTDITIEQNGNNIWRSLPHTHIRRGETEWKLTVGSRPRVSFLVYQDMFDYWAGVRLTDMVDFTRPDWDSMWDMKISNIEMVDNKSTIFIKVWVLGDHQYVEEKSKTYQPPKVVFTYLWDSSRRVDTITLSDHPLWRHFDSVGKTEELSWSY